jgi:flavorubredoxin
MINIYDNLYQFTQEISIINLTFHQYLLLTEEPILIYTGDYEQAEFILPKVKELLNGKKLKYILVSHMESDECGGLPVFFKEYPEVITVCSELTARELPGFGYKGEIRAYKHGDILKGNDFSIKCINYPSEVHLQNGLLFFEEKRKIFFSSDLMLSFGMAAGKTRNNIWEKEVEGIGIQDIPNEEKLNILKSELKTIKPNFIAVMHGFCVDCK